MEIVEIDCKTGETTMRAATKAEMDFRKRLADRAAEESND